MKINEQHLQDVGNEFGKALAEFVNSRTMFSATIDKVDGDIIRASVGKSILTLKPAVFGTEKRFIAVYPAVGSTAILAYVDANSATPYIVSCTEIDRIVVTVGESSIDVEADLIKFNGGENGGTVLVEKLTDRLNKLQSELNSLKTWANTHTHASSTPTNPTSTPVTPFTGTISRFDKSEYENEKITQ